MTGAFARGMDGWGVSAHPEAVHRVWAGEEPEHAGPRRGLLRLRLGKRGTGGPRRHDGPDRWVYPGTPVVLVDGTPAVQGFGTAVLRLPVGPHDIEVQAGGSRGWWRIEITEDRVAELDFVNALDEEPESGRRWRIGPPGLRAVDRYWPALFWSVPGLVAANAFVLVPANLLGWRSGVWPAWVAVMAVVWFLLAAGHLRRVAGSARSKREQPRQELVSDPPLVEPGHIARVYASPEPDIPVGLGLLVLDVRWELVWQRLDSPEGTGLPQMGEYGEPRPSGRRPWIANPTLLVDDYLIEARWARLCIPLEPGRHLVDIAVPRWSGPAGPEEAEYASLVFPTAIELGAMTHRRVTAEVVQHLQDGRYSLEVLDVAEEDLGAWRSPQLRPYPAVRPPLRRLDGEEREHRAYSIAGSCG